jgi:hypothetical protein
MQPTVLQYDVFVSYSHHDKALIEPLVDILATSGGSVFWDAKSLIPGDVWTRMIPDAIGKCKVFVVCWCCQTAASANVEMEIQFAVEYERRIVPVRLCPTPLPKLIANRTWIDLRGQVVHDCEHRHRQVRTDHLPSVRSLSTSGSEPEADASCLTMREQLRQIVLLKGQGREIRRGTDMSKQLWRILGRIREHVAHCEDCQNGFNVLLEYWGLRGTASAVPGSNFRGDLSVPDRSVPDDPEERRGKQFEKLIHMYFHLPSILRNTGPDSADKNGEN